MTRKKSDQRPNAQVGAGNQGGIAERMRQRVETAFNAIEGSMDPSLLPENIVQACETLVTSGAETCRLVALTVTSATAVDSGVPPHIIQAGAGGRDFRSLYKEAVYPVLLQAAARSNSPWQPSRDPFVSNPYRESSIDEAWVQRRNNKLRGAATLLTVVGYVAAAPDEASAVLPCLARNELALLEKSVVIYRIPPRLSTGTVIGLLDRWLAGDSGGRRHEGASVALLRFAGRHLRVGWDAVDSHHVNDPAPYDALCKADGAVRGVGEVKVQAVTVDQLRQLAVQMANHEARRGYLFTRTFWLPVAASAEAIAISAFLKDQDALGRRIDIMDVLDTARLWLPLLDQQDEMLPAFVHVLAEELDRHALAADRRSLARLLEEL